MPSDCTSRFASAIPRLEVVRGLLGVLAVSGILIGEVEAASPAAIEAEHGMVVSAQHYASEVGAGILAEGGNAIDAAVAVGYALAVVDPCCGNIGGGGVLNIHPKGGGDGFFNFPQDAPAASSPTLALPPRCTSAQAASRSTSLAARAIVPPGCPARSWGLSTPQSNTAGSRAARCWRRPLRWPVTVMCWGRATQTSSTVSGLPKTRLPQRSFCKPMAAASPR